MVEISAPASVARGGAGPRFVVDALPHMFSAVEVAVASGLLSASARPGGGVVAGFYGSWLDGPLVQQSRYRLPEAVWHELRPANALYYRCWSSTQPHAWVDAQASLSDEGLAQAPAVRLLEVTTVPDALDAERLDELWGMVDGEPSAASVAALRGSSAVLVRHASSPRRPITAAALTWVAVVSATGIDRAPSPVVLHMPDPAAAPGAPVRVTAGPRADRISVGSTGGGGLAVHASAVAALVHDLEPSLAAAIGARPERLRRTGQLWCWQDLAPPPVDGVGGTVLVDAASGAVLFAASTTWQGGRVLVG